MIAASRNTRKRKRIAIAATGAFSLFSCLAADSLVAEPAESTAPSLIVVVGAPGLPEYQEPFMQSANLWIEAGRKAEAQTLLIGPDSAADSTDYQRLKQALATEPKDSSEALWLILIGHGTFDGKVPKFNLQGPDITADECAEWLRPFQRTVVVVNCASSSGPFISKLSGLRRVIVTATKSGYEQNLTRFHKYFSEAVHDETADLDKDGQVSVLEAFLIASNRVEEFYSSAGRLATEHSLLEDNGDSLGTPADWFQGVRAVKKAQDAASPDGFRAHQIHLLRSPTERKLSPEVRARRDELELQIRKLRDTKNNISEDDYFKQLESIVVEIAVLYEQSETQTQLR